MAPEMVRGETDYGYGVNVYSFAILLWQMITDRVAFNDMESPSELKHQIAMNHVRPSLRYVKSNLLKTLLQECWSKEASVRPSFTTIRKKCEHFLRSRGIA